MLVTLAISIPAFYGQMMAAHLEGDNEVIIGLAGAINLILGGFGGVVFGYFIDRTKQYKAISVGLILTMTVLFVLYTFLLPFGSVALDIVLVASLGFVMMSLWSTGQNFGGELIYPEKESLYVLVLTCIGMVGSAGFMAAAQEIMDMENKELLSGAQVVGIMFSVVTLCSLPFYALVKVKMNRTNQI